MQAAGSRQEWVMVVPWHLALAGHHLGTAVGTRLGHIKRGRIKQLHVSAVPDHGHFAAPKPRPGAAGGEVRGRSSGVQKNVWKVSRLSHFGVFLPKTKHVSSSQQASLGNVSSLVGGFVQPAVLLTRYSTVSVRFFRFFPISE